MRCKISIPVLFLALFALFVLSSCTPKDAISACQNKRDQLFVDECLSDTAIKEKDAAICSRISLEDIRSSCIAEVAISKGDSSLCMDAGKSGNYCLAKVALVEGGSCNRVADTYWRDFCHFEAAKQSLGHEHCSLINVSPSKDECYSFIAINQSAPEICSMMGYGDKKDFCYMKTAVQTLNVSTCNMIPNLVSRYGNCYMKIAKATNNESVCDMIRIAGIRDICKDSVKGSNN